MTPTPGPLAYFNRFPAIWSGPTGPLQWNPPAMVTTPDIQRGGVGDFVTFRQWGFPPGHVEPGEPWGVDGDTRQLDGWDRHNAPGDAVERVRYFDVQRCVPIAAAAIVPDGVAFELVHQVVPAAAVGIVERVHTIWDTVEALDAGGEPVLTYSNTNGERPCLAELEHPDPGVAPLTWEYRLQLVHWPSWGQPALAYRGPVSPLEVSGFDLLPPWSDFRWGFESRAAEHADLVVGARTLVRLWVIFRGPADRYRLTTGARLGGYWQLGGRNGAALDSSLHRFAR